MVGQQEGDWEVRMSSISHLTVPWATRCELLSYHPITRLAYGQGKQPLLVPRHVSESRLGC